MLAGAIVIIVQAPRCKPIPEMNWWNEGPIYQISDVEAFSDGLEGKITLICGKKQKQNTATIAGMPCLLFCYNVFLLSHEEKFISSFCMATWLVWQHCT